MRMFLLLLGSLTLFSQPSLADAGTRGDELDRLVRTLAQSVPGAHEVVARDAENRVKWAGVWLDEERACPRGRLSDASRQLVREGGEYARTHDGRLRLYAPSQAAAGIGRDALAESASVEVKANDLIGKHCYLVIQR